MKEMIFWLPLKSDASVILICILTGGKEGEGGGGSNRPRNRNRNSRGKRDTGEWNEELHRVKRQAQVRNLSRADPGFPREGWWGGGGERTNPKL